MSESNEVVYRIDSEDTIIFVNEAWSAFAESNDGGHLLPETLIGRGLWDIVQEPTTAELYKGLLRQVRLGAPAIRFTFRCDSPTQRRLLQMELTGGENREVRFRVTPLAIQNRPPIAVLTATTSRAPAVLDICGWCKRVPTGHGEWIEIEDAISVLKLFHAPEPPTLNHGICPSCKKSVESVLDDPALGSGMFIIGGLR